MVNAFCDDGYTEEFYVKGVERRYPECRFEARPILPEDRAEYIKIISKETDPKKAERMSGKVLSEHLVKWSLGEDTSPAKIMKLKPMLLTRLANIVIWNSDNGDDDPEKTIAERIDDDETAEFSASKPDADAKN